MNVNIKIRILLLVSLVLLFEINNKSAIFKIEKNCHNENAIDNGHNENYENDHYLKTTSKGSLFELVFSPSKIKVLQFMLRSATDSSITIPFITTFASVGIDLAGEFLKSPKATTLMKGTSKQFRIFKGIIAIDIITKLLGFITRPAKAETVSPIEIRKENYVDVFLYRYALIDNILIEYCNESTAMNILKHYCFSKPINKMNELVKSVEDNGYPLEKFDKFWLRDPKLYEKLRYNLYLEVGLSRRRAIQRIHNIYTQEEMNFIQINPDHLFDDYLTNKLFDTIYFDDYYAVKNFLANYFYYVFSANVENHIYWRIQRALYSLIIRQWDLINEKSTRKLSCILRNDSITVIKLNLFQVNHFTLCFENFHLSKHYYSRNIVNGNKFYYFAVEVTIPGRFLVNLKYIDSNLNQYVIIPGTKFLEDISFRLFISDTTIVYITIVKLVRKHPSEWLTNAANEVSLQEEKIRDDYIGESFSRLKC